MNNKHKCVKETLHVSHNYNDETIKVHFISNCCNKKRKLTKTERRVFESGFSAGWTKRSVAVKKALDKVEWKYNEGILAK